ncbi:hypothetical protein [Serratia marcescens]|uniref:hypothetical protein n=1 Tax=Serratia marcescens TaxID=615 RepID=UPI00217DC901|nr:hypothetical protein [Serratia marcescens]
MPIRAAVYRVAQPDGGWVTYSLILVHHLAFDGWSQPVLLQELDVLYQAQHRAAGGPDDAGDAVRPAPGRHAVCAVSRGL